MVLNAYRDVFPEEAMNWAKYMVSTGSGLDPSADTSDESTPAGWGAKQGSRISDFFKNDGWNQLGNSTKKNYRLAFQDSGKPPYQPKNPPQTPEEELPYPLRWAPLTQSVDGHGRFKSQVHVVPHIATDVRPLVLTEEDFEERTVDGPYQEPDAEGRISKEDTVLLNGFIDNLFNISANLTPVQIAQGSFWDNKFTSSGAIGRHVERAKGLTGVKEAASRYGEALAQHDAVITAWKEKLRHDLVRPVTAVRRLRPGHTVVAYDPVINGPREVLADEWEPLILTQPHSEFPSASATLCTASFEFLKAFIIQETGDAAVPPFVRPFFPMDRNFKTTRVVLSVPLDSAAEQCGQSRLWAGVCSTAAKHFCSFHSRLTKTDLNLTLYLFSHLFVFYAQLHFAPSVEAGNQLGTGIGLASLKHITSLINGEVPEVCYWCPDRR